MMDAKERRQAMSRVHYPSRWSPNEEVQFDQACERCGKPIRWNMTFWQAYDGMGLCFTGQLPRRSDLGQRHEPKGTA